MDVKGFYDKMGERYLDAYLSKGMKMIHLNELEFIFKYLPKKTRSHILEIGVGPGRLTKEFAKKRIDIIGLDVSRKMVKICKERLKDFRSVRIIQHDISNKLPFEDNVFDFVCAFRVLKYLNSPKKIEYALSEISRVIKNRGIFVFSIPNKHSINILYRAYSVPYIRMSMKELLVKLQRNGFVAIGFDGAPIIPDFIYRISNDFFLTVASKAEYVLRRFLGVAASRIFYVAARKIKK